MNDVSMTFVRKKIKEISRESRVSTFTLTAEFALTLRHLFLLFHGNDMINQDLDFHTKNGRYAESREVSN